MIEMSKMTLVKNIGIPHHLAYWEVDETIVHHALHAGLAGRALRATAAVLFIHRLTNAPLSR